MLLKIKFNLKKLMTKKSSFMNHLLIPNYEIITLLKFENSS